VLSAQKVLSGSGHTGRLHLMEKYIGHLLVARPEPENTFWIDCTVNKSILNVPSRNRLTRQKYFRGRGNLTNAILKIDFWRITHFKAATSRLVGCTFVNIIISCLCVKKNTFITVASRRGNLKRLFFSYSKAFLISWE